MSLEPAFPPSGRTINMFGCELNRQPRELLLQVIEWAMIEWCASPLETSAEDKFAMYSAVILACREAAQWK